MFDFGDLNAKMFITYVIGMKKVIKVIKKIIIGFQSNIISKIFK